MRSPETGIEHMFDPESHDPSRPITEANNDPKDETDPDKDEDPIGKFEVQDYRHSTWFGQEE